MQKRKMDYHLHSVHSMDGKQTIDALCKQAVLLGLDEICLTEHIEPMHPTPEMDKPPEFEKWFKEIALAQQAYPHLRIRAGLEIGDNPICRRQIEQSLDALPLDFRLLSLHLVNNVDPYETAYYEGKTQQQAYREYVIARLESILSFTDYDGIAHLGYVCKFAPYEASARPLRYHHAPDELDMLLKHLAQTGKALEINTSGLVQTDSTIPGMDIVERFISLGGEFFTFGSDAHQVERVYQNIEKAKAMVQQAGGRWQAGFNKRVMQVYAI